MTLAGFPFQVDLRRVRRLGHGDAVSCEIGCEIAGRAQRRIDLRLALLVRGVVEPVAFLRQERVECGFYFGLPAGRPRNDDADVLDDHWIARDDTESRLPGPVCAGLLQIALDSDAVVPQRFERLPDLIVRGREQSADLRRRDVLVHVLAQLGGNLRDLSHFTVGSLDIQGDSCGKSAWRNEPGDQAAKQKTPRVRHSRFRSGAMEIEGPLGWTRSSVPCSRATATALTTMLVAFTRWRWSAPHSGNDLRGTPVPARAWLAVLKIFHASA